jgi:ATP-dependent protease Clp ATPase subunit
MLDLMYIVPSRAEKLKKILVTKETVEDGAHPVEIRKDDKEVA